MIWDFETGNEHPIHRMNGVKKMNEVYAALEQRVKRLEGNLDAEVELRRELQDRVEALEEAATRPTAKKTDELTDRVFKYMQSMPGVYMTALVIGANIGEDNTKIGSRLETLARRGLIKKEKETTKTAMFWYEAK